MDDVNMSSLICEEDIIKELEQFNVKFEDKEVITKLKNICIVYDFSAEKLISEWLGFCNSKTWSTEIDQIKVELFENEGFRREKLKLDNKETDFKNDKQQIQLDADMLNDYGVVLTDEEIRANSELNKNEINKSELIENQKIIKSNGINDQSNNTQQMNGHQAASINKEVANDYILENKLNESVELGGNQIQNHFGDLLDVQQWINTDKTKFTIKPLDPDLHITKAFKTVQIKTHEANEILNELIDEMQELIKSKISSEDGQLILGDTLFVGRVDFDTTNTKEKVILFENPRLMQRKIKLDLSKITENYSLFPGKIICFEGELNDDVMIVNKFFDNRLLISPLNSKPIKFTNNSSSLFLMAASGPISPITSDDLTSLENLLEQVKLFQPHYLILLGPFFDCRNDYLLFNCDGEGFFNKIMRLISSSLENIITEAIIVPSTFDLNNYNIYPAPPFEHSFPKIQFMPNPSFIDIDGIVISISSVDIIRHIIREEFKKTDSNDQNRICEHLLTQKSLYPLLPPNQEVNLEYSKLDFIKFNKRPHLFILPSMIKNFVKNVQGSLFINPEYISKGVYSKIRIERPPENYVGSLEEFTKVEIVKNKSTNKKID